VSLKTYGDFDSKFRFVIVAAKRAKQLLKGSKPKIKSKSKNLIRIAQEEVLAGLVEYDIVDSSLEELQVSDGDMFIGEELGINVEDERVEVAEEKVVVEIKKKKSPEESIQEAVKKKVRKKVNENKQ
jgi:DNA-directed RNA polymerase subunit omega